MQRRTAALYVVFFVVVAIAAYSLTTVAEEPSVSVEGQSYTQGQSISAGGTQWTVNVAEGSGNVSTVNRSARLTTSLTNNSSVVFRNGMYQPAPNGSDNGSSDAGGTSSGGTEAGNASGASGNASGASGNATGAEFLVVIPNASSGNTSNQSASAGNASNQSTSDGGATNVSSLTLRQQFDTAARLQADPAVADTTLTRENGTEYVSYTNGTIQPLDAYLPAPRVRNVSVGDSFPYQNNSTRVAAINTTGATLAWRGNLTRSQELGAGENVSLGGTTYVAQFPQNDTVVLSQNVSGYQQEEAAVESFNERVLGLWGVVIISLFAAVILIAVAYLPVRG